MFSKKTRYALMALSVLARHYGGEHLSIGAIAKSQNISQRYLEGILLRLKNEGIVGSYRGKDGGYYLVRKPEEVKLLPIVLLFEDTVAFVSCLSHQNTVPSAFYGTSGQEKGQGFQSPCPSSFTSDRGRFCGPRPLPLGFSGH